MRESEARSRSMLDSSLDAIVMIDEHGAIVEFNPAAERTFGRSRSDVLGEQMAEL
ncbi:MAG TPA: PAS domain S-box protein [Gaiellaceae bacterium]|nr:PAS domain S-box protein [Gaiellaceae bacterium]